MSGKPSRRRGKHSRDALIAAARPAVWLQPLFLSIALILVFVVAFVLYPRAEDGTYWREFIIVAIGTLLSHAWT